MRTPKPDATVPSTRSRRVRRGLAPGIAAVAAAGLLLATAAPASADTSEDRLDFTGGAAADLTVFRPSTGTWYARSLDGDTFITQYGLGTDTLVPEDYTGDGVADAAVFRPETGQWYIRSSSTGVSQVVPFGVGSDRVVPGHWVGGDAQADIAVFRASTGQWWIRNSATGAVSVQNFGSSADIPEPGDYDGDGVLDVAVQKPNGQNWWRSSLNGSVNVVNFGIGSDVNVNADYDGDGITDWGKLRTSGSGMVWYLLQSTDGFSVRTFGTTSDSPAPADYDGDGKADIAIWRGTTGQWWVQKSSNGSTSVTGWGLGSDRLPIQTYIT